jgi:alkylation response protein AidB-like acyl-CoA dehydrogenase
MINLVPTAEQQQVIDSVTDFLKNKLPVERLRDRKIAPGAAERREWQQMAGLGWFGFGLPEELGGIGFSLAEEALAFREFGRNVVSPSVLAATLGAQVAARAGQRELADAILSGAERPGLGISTGTAGEFALSAKSADGELHLVDAQDVKLILVWNDAGAALIRRADLKNIAAVEPMDLSTTLERGTAKGVAPVAFVAATAEPLPLRANVLVSAIMVGMAEAARDLAAEYAKIREQFGKPIGSFQAVAHQCADMAVRAEAAWVQTKFAALAARDRRSDAVFQASAASLLASEAAFRNATMSIRVHGGIGYTADCPVHHYLKRALLLRRAVGGAQVQGARLLAEEAAV